MASPILLIGGPPGQLRKAHELGLDIVYCQFPCEFGSADAALVKSAILADYTDWDTLRPLARAAHEAWGFSAVVSLTESGLDPAGRVSDLLGLGGTSYAVSHRFTDKLLMRRHLAAHAPQGAIAAAPLTGPGSMTDFGAAHGYPFIVKPACGTSSFGVLRIAGPDSVPAAWRRIQRLREDYEHPLTYAFSLDEFMMEEYVEGAFHTVETFSFNGRHVVITITETTTLDHLFVHDGHALPARLDPAVEASIVNAATSFLTVMGLRDGPAHTEIKLSPRGPVVIESQNRAGGALFSDMMQAVYGVDPQRLGIAWAAGLAGELAGRPVPDGGAASWLLVAEPGRVVQIQGLDEVRADPDTVAVDLRVSPGDLVRPFDASWDGLGHVAVRGPDTGAARESCRKSLARIKVQTEPGQIFPRDAPAAA